MNGGACTITNHPLALAEDKRNAGALADVLDELHSEGRVEALIVFFNSLRKDGEPDIAIRSAWEAVE